uniref:Uncharacterized protein n=1 Tax=Caudovirus D_HF5_2C TaxID=3071196 RepID=A0AA96IY75_9CAUD|nr:hypothetical protein [Caudovirus D_HF5_2C]
MYNNIVRLPYTLWYDGKDKIFRMDMNAILPEEHYKDGKKYIGKIRNVQVSGYNVEGDIQPPPAGDGGYLDVSEWSTAVYNEEKHYTDITLKPFSTFNADGEIALYIDFEMYTGFEEYISDYSYKKKALTIIIPIRSHENPSKDPNRFNNGIGIDRMDVRNGFSHTVGANEDPIVFSFDLITRDITDEFITNGQALDMVTTKAVEHVSLTAKDSGLELSLNYNRNGNQTGNISWDNLKQYLGGSNSTEYVPPTLDDIIISWYNADNSRKSEFANTVGSKMTLSVSENSEKDIDVFVVQDVITLNGQPTKSHNLLFTIPRSLLRSEGGTVDTESIKNSILSTIQQQLPNAATIKQEILADVNPRIPDKETLKTEILAAVPSSAAPYELTATKMTKALYDSLGIDKLEFIDSVVSNIVFNSNLHFEKTDESYEVKYTLNNQNGEINKYVKLLTIPFSSLREVSGGSSTFNNYSLDKLNEELSSATDGIKEDLFSKLLFSGSFSLVKDAGDLKVKWTENSGNSHTILSFRYENVVDEPTIKHFVNEGTKDFYTKEEVNSLIQQLKHELKNILNNKDNL